MVKTEDCTNKFSFVVILPTKFERLLYFYGLLFHIGYDYWHAGFGAICVLSVFLFLIFICRCRDAAHIIAEPF